MNLREVRVGDIPQIQIVRNAVKENPLSDPNLVTDHDSEVFFDSKRKRKGWVCEFESSIVGFSIVDLIPFLR